MDRSPTDELEPGEGSEVPDAATPVAETGRPDSPFDAFDDLERGVAPTNDVETHYVRRGAGRPIVFVHGLLMSATEWGPQFEAFGDEYATIAYDVRGHGHTGGSDVPSYDLSLYASDLHELLDVLDVENPILCGHSTGGAIAQVYAATHPDDVAGLVLLDTFSTAPLGLRGRAIFANLRFLGRLDRLVRYKTLNRWQLRAYDVLAPGSGGDGDTIQALIDADPTIPHREVRKLTEALDRFPPGFDPADIDVPVLVLYGENIPGPMQGMAIGLATMLEDVDVTVDVVPGGGHASHLDNPAFVNDAIREFVERVDGENND